MTDTVPSSSLAARSAPPMRVLIISARDDLHPSAVGGDLHMGLASRQLAAAGHQVTHWVATLPNGAREESRAGVRLQRLAPARLLAPAVWAKLLLGGARAYDVVFEEVIGGERTPFLSPVLSARPTIGMWYQDNRPLFAQTYGGPARRAAEIVQALLLRMYRGHRLVLPSTQTRDWMLRSGFPADRLAVYPKFLETDSSGDGVLPFSSRRNLFVSIGAFRPLKRFEEAIELHERLSLAVPDAELALVGRSDNAGYLAELRVRAARSPGAAHIRIVVDATEAEKFALLGAAKALTIHSAIEGFAITVLEAGTRGVPTLTNPGTPNDTVRDGVNGRKVPFGDVAAYAAVLTEWFQQEPIWQRVSEGSRAVAREFTSRTLPAEVEALFESAAADQRRPPPAR
ncbi:MAG TPA: glycosyltransferase family 4 protein [Thermoplasmata archaeon]|nr:glycosyltransferase family 4 protein [Thermoplasmata archaeon]